MIDVSKWTLGELAKVEELSKLSISELENDSTPKAKLLAALAFVQLRRNGESKTWGDVLAMGMGEVQDILGLSDEDEDDEGDEEAADDFLPDDEPKN